MEWTASLSKKIPQSFEKVAPSFISPLLSELKVSIEKRVFDQVQNRVYSRLPDTDVLVSTVQTKTEQVLPLHLQLSLLGAQIGHSLEKTLKELSQKPDRATVPYPVHIYLTSKGIAAFIAAEAIVVKKTTYLFIHPGNRTDLECTGIDRSDTDENRRRKRYR